MLNFIQNGNHTTIQELFCTSGFQKTNTKIIILTLNELISVTAFIGNVLIIIALQKVSSLHPPTKLLFSCLASCDLLVGLISGPISLIQLTSPEHSMRCYYATAVAQIVGVILFGVSLSTLTAISVDRLLALMLRLRYRQVVTLRRVWVLVVIFWLGSGCVTIICIYNFGIFVILVCIALCLLLVISTFSYLKIYLKLCHHQAQVHVHQGQPNGGGISLNIALYKKTVSSAMWIQSTLLACYLPYGIVTALVTVSHTPPLGLAWYVSITPLMFNSTLNPILHCWKMREVRQSVKNTIRKLWCFSS